mmetsp:Transcript_10531/g.13964  ORF Transcript_10531/g.13964 Transcript_10531/m.13964 type:complete len:143 (+) Transcript_10531:152-580(+)
MKQQQQLDNDNDNNSDVDKKILRFLATVSNSYTSTDWPNNAFTKRHGKKPKRPSLTIIMRAMQMFTMTMKTMLLKKLLTDRLPNNVKGKSQRLLLFALSCVASKLRTSNNYNYNHNASSTGVMPSSSLQTKETSSVSTTATS